MFTGIIEEIGRVQHIGQLEGGIRLHVHTPISASELKINDSIAVNGVCLTVVEHKGQTFGSVAVEETLKKTNLGNLHTNSLVNLELPLKFNDRLGGHLILGHVDTVATISSIENRQSSWMFGIDIPKKFLRYIIPVGSVAVDGVSLTVAAINGARIFISIIPHTMEKTMFKYYATGSKVNIEFDLIGKYIQRMVEHKDEPDDTRTGLNEQMLRNHGY